VTGARAFVSWQREKYSSRGAKLAESLGAHSLGKPFVATGNEVVVANFDGYCLFTDHSPEDIAAKVVEAHRRRDEFVPKMAQYIEQDKARWQRDVAEVDSLLTSG